MAIVLPQTIAEYFEADSGKHPLAVARCFAAGAVVKGEGYTYSGLITIRKWKAGASTKCTYTVEPFALATEGERTVVTSHLGGTFPESPTDLRYFFLIADEKIAELEIIP